MHLLPLARLLRLPNVFTAFADIGLGLCATVALVSGKRGRQLLVEGRPACCSRPDVSTRPAWSGTTTSTSRRTNATGRSVRCRPAASRLRTAVTDRSRVAVPSAGRVPRSPAGPGRSVGLALVGCHSALRRSHQAHCRPAPIGMAFCRFLNVLLGLSLADSAAIPIVTRLHLAVTVGVYIVGVTWFARTEEKRERPEGPGPSGAGHACRGAVLALAVATRVPPGTSSPLFPYLLVAFGFWVGVPVLGRDPQADADRVQAAVKRSIFGLVVLDALLASVFVGTWGLLLMLLLPPALLLGKWVYST